MKGRTRPLYDAVLTEIKRIVRIHVPEAFRNISLTISDYESAIQGSMKAAFPNARVRGCWFHYGQVRKHCKLNIFIRIYKIIYI